MDKNFSYYIEQAECEYDELNELIGTVEVMSDHKLYSHCLKKLKKIESMVLEYKKYKKLLESVKEMEPLAQSENDKAILKNMIEEADMLFEKLKTDYRKSGNQEVEMVKIEICAKDAEFREQLLKMFDCFLAGKSFECEKESEDAETAVLKVSGEDIYKNLNIFSGKAKKILCGNEFAANIVVLKTQDFETVISDDDLIIQTSKSSGAGGQHINKTESAVKIIHKPTGIFAECQDERSQTKNKEKALQLLEKKITQKSKEKVEKMEKNQRNEIKNKLFSSTPSIVFDFDANKVYLKSEKKEYKLKEILEGNLDLIINNRL